MQEFWRGIRGLVYPWGRVHLLTPFLLGGPQIRKTLVALRDFTGLSVAAGRGAHTRGSGYGDWGLGTAEGRAEAGRPFWLICAAGPVFCHAGNTLVSKFRLETTEGEPVCPPPSSASRSQPHFLSLSLACRLSAANFFPPGELTSCLRGAPAHAPVRALQLAVAGLYFSMNGLKDWVEDPYKVKVRRVLSLSSLSTA